MASPDEQLAMITSLRETTRLIQSDTIIAAALFDLFFDVLLSTPVPALLSLVPADLSESSYIRLIGGAGQNCPVGVQVGRRNMWGGVTKIEAKVIGFDCTMSVARIVPATEEDHA